MTAIAPISTLFLDIGGVLLTNGWDRNARRRAADAFHLNYGQMDERHHLTFDTYEEGRLSLNEYLDRVVFFESRPFSHGEFVQFMFDQSEPYAEMIDLMRSLKEAYDLKVVAVSNEGRELTIHRIKTFELGLLCDFFISSCFVHFRKPDPNIYRMALDVAQVPPEQVIYIDDRAMFIEVANELGIQGIHHIDYEGTRAALADYGLTPETPRRSWHLARPLKTIASANFALLG